MELQEGGAITQTTPWVVVEADDKQTVQREFSQGEIVDKLPSKDYAVFLVQSPKLPPLPSTVLQGPIYGVGIFRDERDLEINVATNRNGMAQQVFLKWDKAHVDIAEAQVLPVARHQVDSRRVPEWLRKRGI